SGEALHLCTIPHYESDARCVQQLCRQAGVNIELTLLTPEQFRSSQRLEADILLFALVLDNDAELRLIDLYRSMQLHLLPSIRTQLDASLNKVLMAPDWHERSA